MRSEPGGRDGRERFLLFVVGLGLICGFCYSLWFANDEILLFDFTDYKSSNNLHFTVEQTRFTANVSGSLWLYMRARGK